MRGNHQRSRSCERGQFTERQLPRINGKAFGKERTPIYLNLVLYLLAEHD